MDIDILEPMNYNKLIKNKYPSLSTHNINFETEDKKKIKELELKNTPDSLLYENEYKTQLDYLNDFCIRNNEIKNYKELDEYLDKFIKKDDEYQLFSYNNIHGIVNSCEVLNYNEFGRFKYDESNKDYKL